MNVKDYMQRLRKGRGRWLIEPIIGAGHNLLIYGQKGEGKSLLAWEIARAVARGAKLFGKFQAVLGKVLIVDEETAESDFEDRVAWTFGGSKQLNTNIHFWPRPEGSGFTFDDQGWVDGLKAEIDKLKPKLLIIDNLNATQGMLEFEGSNTKVGKLRRICTYLRQNCKDLVIIIIHHEGKDKARGPRGASALGDMSDTEIEVTRVWDEPFRFAVTQRPRKRPVGTRPFVVELRKKGNKWGLKYLGVEENIELPKEEDILMAEHFVVAVPRGEERSIEELCKELERHLGEPAIRDSTRKLAKQQFLTRGRHRSGLHRFSLNMNYPQSHFNRALEGALREAGVWATLAEMVLEDSVGCSEN